ncbi:MAG: glycosyltransferase family 2 protein [Acidobacteria bacterium]|nr:glycosyltransferase family 2 protein [Acidobacteriota bacterium]
MASETVVFWLGAFLLGYTYLGYPVLMWIWASLRSRPPRPRNIEPTVSLVLVAHNEARRIEGRIENLLSLDYPRDRLEILIASDGSTDGTAERARAYEPAGLSVMAFEIRRGKPAVLNDLVSKARGEIVVFADARQRFEAGALRAIVAPFGDPQIGAVSGELILTDDAEGTAVGKGVGFYWRYEKFIRWNESQVDSSMGATGAIYAIRRELFEPIPQDTILDDVWLPMRIVGRGYRVVFAPGARACDRAAATAREEFARKVRTMAGNFQLFARERWLLNPFRNRLWLQTLSHKGLRLVSPFLLAGTLFVNLALVDVAAYRWLLLGQAAFYAAALVGCALRNTRWSFAPLSGAYVFCLLHWAVLVGLVRFLKKRQGVTWERVR